jgi:hypothetical protein
MVKVLVALGGDPAVQAADGSGGVLHAVARSNMGASSKLQYLLNTRGDGYPASVRIDVSAVNAEGLTAAQVAASMGQKDLASALQAEVRKACIRGANLTARPLARARAPPRTHTCTGLNLVVLLLGKHEPHAHAQARALTKTCSAPARASQLLVSTVAVSLCVPKDVGVCCSTLAAAPRCRSGRWPPTRTCATTCWWPTPA